MKPTDLLFQGISNALGGLFNDAFVAILALSFLFIIIAGLNVLKRILLGSKIDNYIKERGLEDQYERYKDRQLIRAKFKKDFKDFDDL